MNYKLITTGIVTAALLVSCVSKKKYVELQGQYDDTRVQLQKNQIAKEEVEAKYNAIENRVEAYNAKIASLQDLNNTVTAENATKYEISKDGIPVSQASKAKMSAALSKVNQTQLANARTLKDTMNLIISHNLKTNLDNDLASEDIDINIDETVVMINISDKLLFKSGSYKVNSTADNLLQRLADVINSEPAIEVMIEGHTDNRTVKNGAYIKDNWELSVERSTAIIRELQEKYNVDPAKMIAAGRSSYKPLVQNIDNESRAINRRTRIVILPNLDKFLSMLADN